MREGSNPKFCPPVEEGLTINFEDSKGDATVLEFLGLLLHGGHRYGVFFPVSEEEPALSSGEVIILEAVEFDEDDQPFAFELVEDEGPLRLRVGAAPAASTKGMDEALYRQRCGASLLSGSLLSGGFTRRPPLPSADGVRLSMAARA